METFFSTLINGLSLGGIYAMIALGYTMVYGIAKMLNFAHGDIIMVGGYTIFLFLFVNPIVAIVMAVIFCVIFGILIEKLAYKPLRGSSPLAVLITAIGVSYLLQSFAQIIFGSATKFVEIATFENKLQLGPLVRIQATGSTKNPDGLAAIYINKGFLLDFLRRNPGKENLPDGIEDKSIETAFNTECEEWEKKKNRFKDLTLLGKGIRILKCPAGKELQMYYASYSYRNSRGRNSAR